MNDDEMIRLYQQFVNAHDNYRPAAPNYRDMLTGDLAADRKCIRDALAQIKNFDGITGEMTFTEQGDPIKCAVIVKIEGGKFTFYDSACP